MSAGPTPPPGLARKAFIRLGIFLPLFFALFFLPAGTWDFWEAWVYLVILLVPMGFVVRYLYVHSPDLLARRLNLRERAGTQKAIQLYGSVLILLLFILPGFDRRWDWSQVPDWLVAAADGVVLVGYAIVVLVFRENRYASRVVETSEEQEVISSGPYAVVRHPMYVGVILLYTATPVALGSYWGLIPALVMVPFLVVRIVDEERVLVAELKGYSAYREKVRYRLVPGVW